MLETVRVLPILKKHNLDGDIPKYYQPVSNKLYGLKGTVVD